MRKNEQGIYLTLAALALLAAAPVLPVFSSDSPEKKNEAAPERQILPLKGKVHKTDTEGPSPEDLNQCPGTMQHYSFPPSGYEPRETDRRSEAGKVLFLKLACKQCHAVDGDGGEMGPPLDGIGGHRGKEWLMDRLLDPEKQMKEFADVFGGRPNIMPHTGVSKKQARLIVDYLLTIPEPGGGFLVTAHGSAGNDDKSDGEGFKPAPESEASERGRSLFFNMHCAACHSTDGTKSRFGPDLSGIGARRSKKRLEKILFGAVRARVMKDQVKGLDEGQVGDLQAFLMTLPPAGYKAPAGYKE